MPAVAERTERNLADLAADIAADPSPPGVGKDGTPVRRWKVNGDYQECSMVPFSPDERPTYWYIGMGAHLRVKSQDINANGLQPTILNDVFVDGSFSPRNPWEEQVTREFLVQNHVDPDKSRDERHPEGPGHVWRCGACLFACPSYHVMRSHQLKTTHTGLRNE